MCCLQMSEVVRLAAVGSLAYTAVMVGIIHIWITFAHGVGWLAYAVFRCEMVLEAAFGRERYLASSTVKVGVIDVGFNCIDFCQ